MKNELTNEEKASAIIKVLLDDNKIDYQDLSDSLKGIGIIESNSNLSNKIQRGKFSLAFVLQILEATKKNLFIETLKNKEVITKEQFIESFMEINEIFRKTENDEIYETLEKAQDLLYKKIGLTNEIIDSIINMDNKIHYFDNPTEQDIGDFYDEIKKENEVSILANDLYSKIAKL